MAITYGSNLNFGGLQKALWAAFNKLLYRRPHALKGGAIKRRICYKAGAPSSNTELDSPGPAGIGLLCVDLTNNNIYVCTAFTNDTTHTWVKITD